jgi:addiction module HigA family antidote
MDDKPLTITMRPPHPGNFVFDEVLEPLHLSITAAAAALGVRRASLSDLVNAKSRLSPEMALRLEKAFGLDMETLLRMQAWHDAVDMREKAETIAVKRYRRAG